MENDAVMLDLSEDEIADMISQAEKSLENVRARLAPIRAEIAPLIAFVDEAQGYKGGALHKLFKKLGYFFNFGNIKDKVKEALAKRDQLMKDNSDLYEEEKSIKEQIENLMYLHMKAMKG